MNLKSSGHKSGHLVLPGERLGVIEEFIPDSGTYVKDGVIYSKIVGSALMDLLSKRVSVYPLISGATVPKVATTVVGQVGNAQSDNVLVRIFKIGSKRLSGVFTGILHISDVQERYVKSMNEVCKPGDIIRTKVISNKNQIYHLSTNDDMRCGVRNAVTLKGVKSPLIMEKRKYNQERGHVAIESQSLKEDGE